MIFQVAKHIYENSIAKVLKNQTVLLVTHGLQFLEKCDKIAFMKNGSITEFGTYQELMADGKGQSGSRRVGNIAKFTCWHHTRWFSCRPGSKVTYR